MKHIKLLALLLACLMLIPLSLVSCGDKGDGGAATTPPVDTSDLQGEGEDQLAIPEDRTYGGRKFIVLGWSDEPSTYDFYNETGSDQKVQSAIYRRNEMLQHRMDIELTYSTIPGNNSNKDAFVQTVDNAKLNDPSEFDVVACYSMCAVVLTVKDLLIDMTTLEFPEFEKSWWSQSLMENCKLNDGIYFCSGDLATSTMMQAFLVGVNMDTLARYEDLTDPRKLVQEGTWTYEMMFQMAQDKGIDRNDNSNKDTSDAFGIIASSNALWDSFFIGSGMTYLGVDSEGVYDLTFDFGSEKNFDLIEYLAQKLKDDADVANVYDYEIFTRGDSLFALSELGFLMQNKNDIGFNYSFVPIPKYEKDQKNYYTTLGFPFSFYAIPKNADDAEMSGTVLEYMEYQSNKQLRPAVFEAVKYQESNNALDAQMFDLIINGITYDLGRIMHGVFEGLGGDGWKASPVMIFRRGIMYGENLYTQLTELEGPLNTGLDTLNNFKSNS